MMAVINLNKISDFFLDSSFLLTVVIQLWFRLKSNIDFNSLCLVLSQKVYSTHLCCVCDGGGGGAEGRERGMGGKVCNKHLSHGKCWQ